MRVGKFRAIFEEVRFCLDIYTKNNIAALDNETGVPVEFFLPCNITRLDEDKIFVTEIKVEDLYNPDFRPRLTSLVYWAICTEIGLEEVEARNALKQLKLEQELLRECSNDN